jgi:hypothetical protein
MCVSFFCPVRAVTEFTERSDTQWHWSSKLILVSVIPQIVEEYLPRRNDTANGLVVRILRERVACGVTQSGTFRLFVDCFILASGRLIVLVVTPGSPETFVNRSFVSVLTLNFA